ncbi:hypothetical protein DV451_000820 [Geotrichum candidum]|uniref:Thiamine-binding protein domain-containing protein n=1 Tax=Geotrichum candidum TaxID=1173061 RepID=A0A9P5GA84_GEOCN|nr:hypothetical protein DV451_000820 [Geotrichum candidum]KAI9210107.1 hypothetical protein DS838_005005 [Geotrichum bryndzae]KAF5106563.1 hypothetical protein DV453_003801 [Geotrichum candidum]KAF5108777.1 hypothetical protein DV454_005088 [Geotrichum candidum]KAF5117306.1 hypothetical protein DV452_002368 [Geotrichum candidum]
MTKLTCLADVCLIPIGTPTASVSTYVTAVVDVVRKSGLHYVLHSAGTTIEGPWDEVMGVLGRAHEVVHEMGVVRIQSDIRVGTRTDKKQTPEDKVESVLSKLEKLDNKQ